MSSPIPIPPTCNINCVSQSPSDIDCQTTYFWEALESDFTMPAATGTGTIVVCNSAHYVTNAFIWLVGAGLLEITAKPTSGTLTVRNNGTTGNADALSVIAAGASIVHMGLPEVSRWIEANETWDPGNIADGAFESEDIDVVGAVLGDFVLASFSLDIQDMFLSASVSAADVVTVVLHNETGGALNLAEGTLRVRVLPM